MARAKKKAGRKAVKNQRKTVKRKRVAKRRSAPKRKPAAAATPAPPAPRPVLIPGAWPFPMGSKP
jgi:hypothetical protein